MLRDLELELVITLGVGALDEMLGGLGVPLGVDVGAKLKPVPLVGEVVGERGLVGVLVLGLRRFLRLTSLARGRLCCGLDVGLLWPLSSVVASAASLIDVALLGALVSVVGTRAIEGWGLKGYGNHN